MREAILNWSERTRRDLPWRRTRDPWAVLVSEVMLQQTQVARVVLRYHAFLEAFPTPEACARASRADVVRAWAGLGYNRRAVNLHRAAMAVVEHHGGRLPDDRRELEALPGVGTYTARAVLAFAFERDVGVVEVNTARVLARAFAGRALKGREAQQLADELAAAGDGWRWNQAMLDLGATVCVKRDPNCAFCPVAHQCAWSRSHRVAPDPADGTAGTGRQQSRFAGSDRQGRGRLVDALRAAPVSVALVPEVTGWRDTPERAARVVAGLVDDGLVEVVDGRLRLAPG